VLGGCVREKAVWINIRTVAPSKSCAADSLVRRLSDRHIFVNGREAECTRLIKSADALGNDDCDKFLFI
jgi:hypothetical protein